MAKAEEPPKEATVESMNLFVENVLNPFWSSSTMMGESVFFCERISGEPASARLLFAPETLVSVKSAMGDVVYEEGKDFALDKEKGVITLRPGSRIPVKTQAEMYPLASSALAKIDGKRGDPKTHLIFGEGAFFHKMQVEVTYTHKPDAWTGFAPKYAGGSLPNTMAKLKSKQPITLCVSGDSISTGANASGKSKVAPFMPGYPTLVALGLEKAYGTKVALHNFAVGGWTSSQGLADAGKVAKEQPELVVIAYGMNDGVGSNPANYIKHTKGIMEKVKAVSPKTEFILVATMLPNAEWSKPNLAHYPVFRAELAKICGVGVVLADMTSLWEDLLKVKSHHDLTGNGVNHPNDFTHRVYAQLILALLVEPAAKAEK